MIGRIWSPLKALGVALVLAAGGGAHAQEVDNNELPIDITANALELIDAQRVQIWDGAVEAVQGVNRLRTERLRVFHAVKAGTPPGETPEMGQWGEPERMVADGMVYFLTPESVAKGDTAVYDLIKDVITLNGDVVLTRGESVLRGDTLVIDVATGRSTLDSKAQGRGTQRVRGVFYPEEEGRPAAAPRAPAAPPATPR